MGLAIHLGWKIYHCVYLVSPVSVVGEPLEVDHKHLKVFDKKLIKGASLASTSGKLQRSNFFVACWCFWQLGQYLGGS